jgi:Type IV secretion-system coupling protein DNA-binding domain
MEDEQNHVNVFTGGLPQMGKTTLLLDYLYDCIHSGYGAIFFDTDGSIAEKILDHIPPERTSDVILFDPTDPERIVTWNPLADNSNPSLTADAIKKAMKAIWLMSGTSTGVMDLYIKNSIQALIEAKETLLGFSYLLTNQYYRDYVLEQTGDWVVQDFWKSHEDLGARLQTSQRNSTYNKAHALLSDIRIRRLLSFQSSSFSADDVIENNKLLIVRLPKSVIDEDSARIVASLLLMDFVSAMYRRRVKLPFYCFIDQCDDLAETVVSEWLINGPAQSCFTVLATKYLGQLTDQYKEAVLGACATKYMFRSSEQDAEYLEKVLGETQLIKCHELEPYQARIFPYKSGNAYLYTKDFKDWPIYKKSYDKIRKNHDSRLTKKISKADDNIKRFRKKLSD